jgi:hypothetical protein
LSAGAMSAGAMSAGAIVRRRLPSDPEAEVRFGVGTNPKPTSKTENTGMG